MLMLVAAKIVEIMLMRANEKSSLILAFVLYVVRGPRGESTDSTPRTHC